MRKLLLALLFLMCSVYTYSQNENPFKEFGYDVLVATSSKGEFQEFHDQTDIVEIGSVLYNRKTKEIVKILDKDSTTIDISSAISAMTIDPLCEKYYWISPYAYCLNNPINAIDPDGRKVIFTLPLKGGGTMNFTYNTSGQLVHSNGQVLKITEGSHLDRVVTAYNKMLNSGDSELSGQLTTLINSDKEHFVSGVPGSDNSVTGGDKSSTVTEDIANAKAGKRMGSNTRYNFSEEEKAEFKKVVGVENSDFTTVAHEIRHAYDYDKGLMKDSFDKKGNKIKGHKSPAEQRAMKSENRARKIENLPLRTKYGDEEDK